MNDETLQSLLDIALEALECANNMLQELNNGDRIIVPKDKEHAENMLTVANFYIDNYDANMAINRFLK